MIAPEACVSQFKLLIGQPCHVEIEGRSSRCYVFDWTQRDEDLALLFEDTFGDGAPSGFEMGEADTLLPFAILGQHAPDDGEGQPEGVLFFDLASGAIISFDIDGTAIVDSKKTAAPGFSSLALAAGPLVSAED